MQAITIIVPCYNRAATLERALESCIAQREAEKIIVVDDGSTDATANIARVVALRDQRVRLIQTSGNGSAARARNWGALQATTPLIAFLDPDDEYLPGALAAAHTHLAQAPREAAVRLDVDYCGFPAELAGHRDFASLTAMLSNTVPSSLVIRLSAFLALGGFPMDDFFRRHGGDDGALAWALSEIFGQRRLDNAKRVRMNYYAGCPAERFLRVRLGLATIDPAVTADVLHHSRTFLDASRERIAQVRAFSVTNLAG
jgi:glycosyltransferase involved in cell wall biosynthesis